MMDSSNTLTSELLRVNKQKGHSISPSALASAIKYKIKRAELAFLAIACIACPAVAWGTSNLLEFKARMLIALCIFTIAGWAFSPFGSAAGVFALLNLICLPAIGIVPTFKSSFGAAGESSIWLIFSGMVISIGLRKTNIILFLSRLLIKRSTNKLQLIQMAVVVGWVLAFSIPSSVVRALLVGPVCRTILDELGYTAPFPSPESASLHLALLLSTINCGQGFLTGTAPNLIAASGIQKASGQTLGWGLFAKDMVLGFWVLMAPLVLASVWFTVGRDPKAFREYEEKRKNALDRFESEPPKPSAYRHFKADTKVGFIVVVAILLFVTDPLHDIPPVYIGLAAVVMLTFPIIGPVEFSELRGINYPALMLMISIIAMGDAVASNEQISAGMERYLRVFVDSASSQFGKYFMTVLATIPLITFSNTSVTAGIGGHLWPQFAKALGMETVRAGLCVSATMPIILLPHQNGPILITVPSRFWTPGQFFRASSLIALGTLFLMVPIQFGVWVA